MKKLLLLLLLSLSYLASADTITYRSNYSGDKLYANDGSECRIKFNKLVCEGGDLARGGVTYSNIQNSKYFYGDDGSECYITSNNNLECKRKEKKKVKQSFN